MRIFALAVTGATLMATAAAAAPAQSTTSLNVRSGPGTSYGVIDTLRPGESVDVRECRTSGWCYVTKAGPDGWVSARYLTGSVASGRDEPVVRSKPNVSFSFSFGRGDGFSINEPPRGGSQDLVCLVTFFERSQVQAGRDADVRRARVLPRAEAERRDGPNDRQAIFDYGTNQQTRDTCRYLNQLNRR